MYNTTIYLRYTARELEERAICMSGDDERQTRTTTNPSKFVGYGSVDADDEAEGLEAPYINQSKWMDYATLEASCILRLLDI